MKYQAVIFDLFGTLVDIFSVQEHDELFHRMAARLGASGEKFGQLWKEGFRKRTIGEYSSTRENILHICSEMNLDPGKDELEEIIRMRVDFTRNILSPRKDALHVLEKLRGFGLKVGLLTDCSTEVPKLWGNTAFLPFFDATVFSCDTGMKKPDPRIYHLICEKLHVDPMDCLYVGDGSSHELSGAKQVKMDPVLIRVPEEDNDDAYRIDDEDWDGKVIISLLEVLDLVL